VPWVTPGRGCHATEATLARPVSVSATWRVERRGQRLLTEAGYFSDKRLADLFTRQARALDPAERKKLLNDTEKIVLGHVYYTPGIWWARSVVHWAEVKNDVAPPNHYANQKLQDVWLSED
jgi:hypothetical protein